MAKPIGIDLGTTMSAMAVVDDLGQPRMIPNKQGKMLTPSAILMRGDERIVGDFARNSALARPGSVVMFVKRQMDKPESKIPCDGGEYTAEELSGVILRKLKLDAEKALGQDVPSAVVTVPAYFGDRERNRTRAAGQIAGLDVIDIINEPTAAAIAYGLSGDRQDRTILVYDLGGGTFDITIMAVERGNLRVLTSNGDRKLGGVDFDEALARYFAEKFKAKYGGWPLDEPRSYQDFRDRAENAKISLSDTDEVPVSLTADGKVLDLDLQRSEFEALIRHYIDQTRMLTERALADASRGPGQIDNVLLVGGSTRIPAVAQMVRDLIGKEPESGINPDEVVAIGAAVYAANERGVAVRDNTGRELAPARVQNVTAHSLGIKIQDYLTGKEINSRLIAKDKALPATGNGMFTTLQDNQAAVDITVLQGEDDDPAECVQVGDVCRLDGIPPQPRGVPQIGVTLEYDKSGIVQIHARDTTTGREVHASITYSALSSDQVEGAIARVEQAKVR
jgi:molecular chaperone DnaK